MAALDVDDRSLSSISLSSSGSTTSIPSPVQVGLYDVNCIMTLTQLVWVIGIIVLWIACCIAAVIGIVNFLGHPIGPNILFIISISAMISGGLPLLGCIICLLWSYCRRSPGYSSIV